MWKYLRFGYIHWIWIPLTIIGFLIGGIWTWSGFAFLFVIGVGGEVLTRNFRDETNPQYSHPLVHDLIIYSVVLGHAVTLLVAAWVCSQKDSFAIGSLLVTALELTDTSFDILAARASNEWFHYLGVGMSLGSILGVSGVSAAHELTHRTHSSRDMFFGRWDFALSFGTNFATEHVFGHHLNLGYQDLDTVSPKRGVGFYEFLTRGGFKQWRDGFSIERERLLGAGLNCYSLKNRIIDAWLRGLLVALLVFAIGGTLALGVWLLAIAFSKYILEGLNFFSHYGLIRLEGERVTTRNTYSSFNPLSNHFTFNLGRHGSHHEFNRPYYLHRYEAMPECPYGYLTMTLVSWFPPIFWKLMIPMLRDWDENWATAKELEVIIQHNKESGILKLSG